MDKRTLMTPKEFADLAARLESTSSRRGYSDKSIEAARLVLVMGASISEAAVETSQSRQSVSQLMQRIKKRIEAIPSNWVRVEQWFPPDVAAQLNKLSRELEALPKENPGKVTIFLGNKQV